MIELSSLDPSQLSMAAQRALGPGPGRMMASKGMLPLPPADQVAVLYQLHLDADASIAEAARATASSLPDKLLTGTLADPTLDPRVLHFFGQNAADKQTVFDAIALNPSVADGTLAMLAAKGDARGVDQLAQNEQRLLRHPEIIAAMYMNRRARMSTIDRVVELAVRNQVRVPGLAAWDEVARALTGAAASDAKVDAVFDDVVNKLTGDDSAITTGDANQPLAEKDHEIKDDDDEEVPFGQLPIPAQIRIATLGNAVARGKAVRSAVKIVALAAIKSPGVTEMEAARYAGNPGLGEDVIRYIAQKREWTKLYGVKVALCRNPKTPISESTKMMPFLRERDLSAVGNSRGIPSAVVSQAKKLMMQRRGGDKK